MSKWWELSWDWETRPIFPANRQICCKAHTILDLRRGRETFGEREHRAVKSRPRRAILDLRIGNDWLDMGLQHGPTVAFFFETGINSGLRHQSPISGFWMLPSQRQSFLRETGLINLSPDAAAEKGFRSRAAQVLPVASMPNSNSIARDCAAGICPKQNT
jgi:hypothetical protein